MPFIDTKTNVRLSEEKETVIKSKLGSAIAEFPGKNEYWLMLSFEDNCRMWFRGYNSIPMAMVTVQLFGTASEDTCAQMTKTVTKIFKEELNISPEHVYVKYEFVDIWGWNGENL